ncbi:hypothetical protein SLEP1_g29604 [Rubroshorea leprosula]|uniref:Reverse transcriptase domain-containing protein n=1 Tax=Rubroshorea leprosula TaxID=152421 RepID=A0AAV5JXG2_9ROSI|nr:hypothetical protein SLEP1_g29604 [Rubroshorea leprosula]
MLWEELLGLIKEYSGGCWCIGGDFNAIRGMEEKRGRSYDAAEAREFNKFIIEAGVEDIPLTGRKFTWYKADGTAMSRLDRFLLSTEFLINFPNVIQKGLRREFSDHCPVLLRQACTDWGPKPFRCLDSWLNHDEFEKYVKEKWQSYNPQGWSSFKLKEKLKNLKKDLKIWNNSVYGNIDKNIETAKEGIRRLDEKGEVAGLTDAEVAQRKDCFYRLWEWNKARDSLLHQKSRQKWLKEGDANSKFFHGCVIKRRKQNGIDGMQINGEWTEEVVVIKNFIKEFYRSKFQEEQWHRPRFELNNFKRLSIEENDMLVADFSEEEIREAVWSCNGNKSPGPDGLNFNLIKRMWPILKEDICEFMCEFHSNGRLVKGSNASFIVLIPKKENPSSLLEYRPISLIGCMYKIVAKLLANRMRKVMNSIISQNQSAFIGGRHIADGIIITNELIHDAKRRKWPTLIFKADFEKAYDSVNWCFLDCMLQKLGFCEKWRLWIQECLASATTSVLVNGSPTEEFKMSKGLRQGDPLAPFLFLVVAEALNGLIIKAVEEGMLTGVRVGSGDLDITHLQFADDTIIFCEASPQNVWVIKGIFRSFELISGLKVNFFKSSLSGINVEDDKLSEMADSINCVVGDIPFKYLGVPVGANPRKISTWASVIECLRRKLSSWRCDSLSFGGRIILLKAVLSSIPVYYFSTLKAPKKVINLLSLIQRRFLWGGSEENKRISWVGWDSVCKSKEEGGLGVKNLGIFNVALLGKWRWRLLEEENALWRRVIEAKYKVNRINEWRGGEWDVHGSSWWKELWRLDTMGSDSEGWLSENIEKVVREGSKTLFWLDKWAGPIPLKSRFNRLFRISGDKDALISTMGEWEDGEWKWRWRWRRNLLAWELELLQELTDTLQGNQLIQGQEDYWIWQQDYKGKYTVKSAYNLLQTNSNPGRIDNYKLIWNKNVPLKVSAFAWKATQNKIPTKDNLWKRGIRSMERDLTCTLCGQYPEETDHLLFTCRTAWLLWSSCYNWWGIAVPQHHKGWNHLQQHADLFFEEKSKQAWLVTWFAVIWSIWTWRNQKVFNENTDSVSNMFELIKIRSLLWLKASLWPNISKDLWLSNPIQACRRVMTAKA